MISLVLYFIPICLVGLIIYYLLVEKPRFEIAFPAGSILGLAMFTFLLNILAFFLKGSTGILTTYWLFVILGIAFFFKKRKEIKFKINIRDKFLFYWLVSIWGWGAFIYWKAAHALIGSDVNLYWAVAHTFAKGNFPPLTPWQPDLPLSYHLGASELLGALHFLTNLDFQFLHIFLSFFFIFCSVQIVIWILDRHQYWWSWITANLTAAVAFISFGFIYVTWPNFPLHLPTFTNFNQFIIWLRDLPSVNQAIEVYGAPVNLDGLIYFIFQSFGIAIFLSLLAILINYKKEKMLITWIVIFIGLAALALINESIFVAAFPALVLGMILIEKKEKTFKKNLRILFLFLCLMVSIILIQGGTISSSIFPHKNIDKSIVLFPKKNDVKEDFISYHLGQSMSKLLPKKNEWFPLRWFHMGIDLLLVISLVVVIRRYEFRNSILLKSLFIGGLSSLLAYHYIVPQFLVANGNRFLAISFILFSLTMCFSFINYLNQICSSDLNQWIKKLQKIFLIIIFFWIILPTILPPLALLSKTRFGENKLQPKKLQISPGIEWIRNNLPYSDRVIVLDSRSPHPSGQARAMVESGVFAPVFTGDVRAFTIEPSPEYIDIAYYLSPKALKKLKVSTILIDADFYQTMLDNRKKQLDNNQYFTLIYTNYSNNWEKIYKVEDKYLTEGDEMEGTFDEMGKIISKNNGIYIDNEENFNPNFLRRPLIFALRDRDLYFNPQSGVYLNVEADILFHQPNKEDRYDYLILGKNTDPEKICQCQPKLFWQGLKDEVKIWRVSI